MSRSRPPNRHHLLYLGEIAEPPSWLPSVAYPTIEPILDDSRIGIFTVESPSPGEVEYLERVARESNAIVYAFKAGGTDFCTYIGSRKDLCERRFGGEGEETLSCEDFLAAVERYSENRFELKLRSGSLTLGGRTRIMGILNVTPDSFSDGGAFHNFDAAVARAEKMIEEGVDIIDVGGESTRPGADAVPPEEEAKRVLPVIEHLTRHTRIPVSIDTCKAEIARVALEAGAEIVNDISALRFDKGMVKVVRDAGCPLILMHMRGEPKSMQESPRYDALFPEIICFLRARMDYLLQEGVKLDQIIVDPGIGFGKTVEHNLEILRGLTQLKSLGRPILVGPSRKSTIGKILNADVYDRIEGTAAAVTVSIANGAHIVRVHDIKEMSRVAKMTDAIMGKELY